MQPVHDLPLVRPHWSSQFAVYLGTIGAAVGLGSIWRFPYLAGTLGGGVFIGAFVLACLFIATPLLVAEYMIGRYHGLAPIHAAGAMAASVGRSRRWDVIGQLGTIAAFLICSYYTIVAGWVVAYAWKCGTGTLAGMSRPRLQLEWQHFTSDPWQLMGWQSLLHGIQLSSTPRPACMWQNKIYLSSAHSSSSQPSSVRRWSGMAATHFE